MDGRTGDVAPALQFAAVDLDGTVLDADDRLIGDTAEALCELHRRGVTIVLVTGRSATSFRTLRGLDRLLAACDHEVLVDEGDVVLDRHTGAVRCAALLPDAAVHGVARDCADHVLTAGGRLIASTRRAATAYAVAYRIPRSLIGIGEPHGPVNRITVFGPPPPVIPRVAVEVIAPFSATVLKPAAGGKAAGLTAWLAGRFGEPDLTRVIAVGDGDGDAGMLASSGLGVAVRRSTPSAVAAASIHLDGPLEDFLRALDPSSPAAVRVSNDERYHREDS